MYIDLIIFLVLLVIVLIFYKRFDSFVLFIAIFDIFLRIITFIKSNIDLGDITKVIGSYLPESIPSLINKYLDNSFSDIVTWIYVIIMSIFLFYIIKLFYKKKKM